MNEFSRWPWFKESFDPFPSFIFYFFSFFPFFPPCPYLRVAVVAEAQLDTMLGAAVAHDLTAGVASVSGGSMAVRR
jgi:hypothetical protein